MAFYQMSGRLKCANVCGLQAETAVSGIAVLPNLDPATYKRHALHADDRVWIEKNCYVDIWIEVIHALGLNPLAILPFTLAIDFEDDQWTFYKPPHDELRELYGIDVQELNVWRPLVDHAVEHLGAGKLISTEADAYWLPDTAGTDYRRGHTKSTIVLADIDVDAQRLGYFHNAGYYSLEGEDFRQLFRINFAADATFMPLFAELVRIDRIKHRSETELAAMSLQLLHKHWQRLPATNPITRCKQRFESDLAWIQGKGLPFYHTWAFGTLRQLGSAYELAALHLRHLHSMQEPHPQGSASSQCQSSAGQRHGLRESRELLGNRHGGVVTHTWSIECDHHTLDLT
jgi:hypothetical protein